MSALQYPRPRDWQQFERLCRALIQAERRNQFNRHGRIGQRQHGVDIYGYNREGKVIAVQCKSRQEDAALPYDVDAVNKAILDLGSFPLAVAEFHFMTTASADQNIEKYAMSQTEVRVSHGLSSVTVWGWETISDALDGQPEVASQFYPWSRRLKIKAVLVSFVLALILGIALILTFYQNNHK